MLPSIAFLSGISGLGYEIVWTRALGLVLGHEAAAALAVVCAFFAGLALGSLILSSRIACSARPARLLAMMEAGIGVWALVLAALLPFAGAAFARALGPDASPGLHWAAAFGFTTLLLLPATFAMGGTLPALTRALSRAAGGSALATAYALNTAGAVCGTMLATLVLLPGLGFGRTQLVLAGINAACAMLAWRAMPAMAGPAPAAMVLPTASHRLGALLFATGALAIGYEVLCLRVMAQVFENTIFTFASLLSVFLLGGALGGAMMRPAALRRPAAVPLLCAACAVACALGLLALDRADVILHVLRGWLGASEAAAVLAEMGCGAAVLFLPSVAMGALFARLASGAEPSLGRVLAANLAGSALAPLLFGVFLLPLAGPSWSLLAIALCYVLLIRPGGIGGQVLRVAAFAMVAVIGVAARPKLDFLHLAGSATLVAQRTGPTATVSVVQDAPGRLHLQINSHFRQGGSASLFSDTRETFLPLLLHAAPHRVLYLGLGTGATIGAARAVPDLAADGVELVPEVLPLLRHFALPDGPLEGDKRITLHVADARRFVRAGDALWDVIIADLYFPAVDGAGALYTREHFAAIARRMAPGGLFCQWLPLHQMDFATLRPILRSFLAVFPDGQAWLAHLSVDTPLIGLISRAPGLAAGHVARAGNAYAQALRGDGLANDFDLLTLFLAGPAELRRFAGNGPRNTDDWPIATWRAPRAAYAPSEKPADRLLALLAAVHPHASDVLRSEEPRLEPLWRARDAFLRAGAGYDPASGLQGAMSGLAPELLAAVRISPDFAPAYDPLLAMSQALARQDPDAARHLLEALVEAAPLRPEAAGLLAALPP